MSESRRTRRLLPVLLALIGLVALASWGYVGLGTSPSPDGTRLSGIGRSGIIGTTSERGEPTPGDNRPAASTPTVSQRDVEGPHQLGVDVSSVTGLYPGRTMQVPVRYTNPRPFALVLDQVRVDTTGAPGCPAQHFRTGTAHPQTVLAGRSTTTSSVTFGMSRSAPDACMGVPVSIDVTVSAVQA